MGGRTGVLVAVRWILEDRKELLEASVCFLEAVRVNVEQGPLILTFFSKQYASCVFGLALRTVSLPTFTS
jgi:hypothetical protein